MRSCIFAFRIIFYLFQSNYSVRREDLEEEALLTEEAAPAATGTATGTTATGTATGAAV